MTGRAYLLPVALAAAVGLPYVASDDHRKSNPSENAGLNSPAGGSSPLASRSRTLVAAYPQSGAASGGWYPHSPSAPVGQFSAGAGGPHSYSAQPPYGGVVHPRTAQHAVRPSLPLEMLFRFDITPQWIIHTWPQVSSELTDPPLSGLRTAVVTGTALQDLAGSVTYYFDGQQQLQRIMFYGTTGDPSRLVQLLTTHYQMTNQPALNGATYVTRNKDQVTSLLSVRLVPLVRNSEPHRRYDVVLELNRPGGSTALSAQQTELLEQQRKLLNPAVEPPKTGSPHQGKPPRA